MGDRKGFTLLELQVAVVLLLFLITGMAVVMMNDLRQLQWLESRRQLYTFIPSDFSKTVFTETTSLSQPSGAVNRVEVDSFTVAPSSITAKVTLVGR